MNTANEPTLSFTCDFDDVTAWEVEVEQKGWFECATLTLPNGIQIPLSFWDPVRLSQDLKTGLESSSVCLAERCLIVVPSVTREYMEKAVNELLRRNYFDRLIALGQQRLSAESDER